MIERNKATVIEAKWPSPDVRVEELKIFDSENLPSINFNDLRKIKYKNKN